MKSITEFQNFTLNKALKTKAALVAEGKTPEEISAGLGEAFKLEGEKLKHFVNALDVAAAAGESLKRVMVISLAEGEAVPAKATKVDEFHYVTEMLIETKYVQAVKADSKGGKGGGGKGRSAGGPKESPWGMSPEQKAAKKSASLAAKAAAKPASK